MKTKVILLIVTCLVLISLFNNSVHAMETGFETRDLSQELQDRIWGNIQLSVSESKPTNAAICSFDVNENGDIALGLCNNTINIYDSNGQYQYSYFFTTSGSYSVEWDNDKLLIFLVRSSALLQVDSKGKLVEMKKATETADNSIYLISLRKPRRTVNDSVYVIKNELGFFNLIIRSSYSKLVKTDANGTQTVIYDVSRSYNRTFIIGFIAFIIFATTVIGSLARYYILNKHLLTFPLDVNKILGPKGNKREDE